LWWFAVCFPILQSHLTLDVAHWLRRWALWTSTCLISGIGLSSASCRHSCLSSHCLLKAPYCSPFGCALPEFLSPLLCASFRLIFIVQFFCGGMVSLPRWLCWFITGVTGGIPCDTWCSPAWSAWCLPYRCGASVWWWWQPSGFLSVMWHGEAFYRVGVQGIEVLILLGALFLPSMAPASQQGFWLMELTLSASVP
jgi:hypothetical protein